MSVKKRIFIVIVIIALILFVFMSCDTEKKAITQQDRISQEITPPTKPDLSSESVRWTIPITFQKVEGHTYRLKDDKSGVVFLNEMDENTGVVTATQAVSDVVVVATKGSETIDSDPIEFTVFIASSKVELIKEIAKAIEEHGDDVNLNYIDTSEVTDMSSLFKDNTAFNGNISEWDVSSVTTMQSMFNRATKFNQDISDWDVSKVTNMYTMFANASNFNQDISSWDVLKVVNMNYMFLNAKKFNQDLNKWEGKVLSLQNKRDMFLNSGVTSPPSWYSAK